MGKNILLLGFSRLTQSLFLVLSYKLLTMYLEKSDVGFYFLLLAFSSYLSLVLINPVGVFANRYVHLWREQGNLRTAVMKFLVFLVVVSLAFFPLFYACHSLFGIERGTAASFAALICAYTFASSLNNTIIPNLNILGYRVAFVVFTFLSQFGTLAISCFLVLKVSSTAEYWLVGSILSLLLFAIGGIFYLFKKNKTTKNTSSFQFSQSSQILSFCTPIMVTNIFLWILSQYYRPFAERVFGLEFLSYFGLGFGLAASISVSFEYLFQQVFYPDFYKEINSDEKKVRQRAWNNLVNLGIPLYLVVPIFISFLAPFVVLFMSSSEFSNASYFLVVGAWVEFFRMSSNLVNLSTQSEGKTIKSIKPYFYASLVTVVLSIVVAKLPNSKQLVPYVFLLGNVFAFSLLAWMLRSIFSYELNLKNILHALLLCCVFPTAIFLYQYAVSFWNSVLILIAYGMYFLFCQYILFRKITKEMVYLKDEEYVSS